MASMKAMTPQYPHSFGVVVVVVVVVAAVVVLVVVFTVVSQY